jgi:hypothetical protein
MQGRVSGGMRSYIEHGDQYSLVLRGGKWSFGWHSEKCLKAWGPGVQVIKNPDVHTGIVKSVVRLRVLTFKRQSFGCQSNARDVHPAVHTLFIYFLRCLSMIP